MWRDSHLLHISSTGHLKTDRFYTMHIAFNNTHAYVYTYIPHKVICVILELSYFLHISTLKI